jgi:hypothetical protein
MLKRSERKYFVESERELYLEGSSLSGCAVTFGKIIVRLMVYGQASSIQYKLLIESNHKARGADEY